MGELTGAVLISSSTSTFDGTDKGMGLSLSVGDRADNTAASGNGATGNCCQGEMAVSLSGLGSRAGTNSSASSGIRGTSTRDKGDSLRDGKTERGGINTGKSLFARRAIVCK
jgi:hypothetical protein